MLEDDVNLDEAGTMSAASGAATASRKRRGRGIDGMTLGVVALIALAAGGLYYMHARTASGVAILGGADADTSSVQSLLATGRAGLADLSRNIDATRRTIAGFTHRDTAVPAGAKVNGRDPFEFHSLEPTPLAAQPGLTNQAAREAARAKALEAARKLQVQSIMFGTARRSCLVDGKLYFEGQPVGDFTISRIAPAAVTVQSGEFKFELRLRK